MRPANIRLRSLIPFAFFGALVCVLYGFGAFKCKKAPKPEGWELHSSFLRGIQSGRLIHDACDFPLAFDVDEQVVAGEIEDGFAFVIFLLPVEADARGGA